MIRHLAPLPASWDLPQLTALTVGRYASARGVNLVDNGDGTQSLAVYFKGFSPTAASLTAWRADVAGAIIQRPTVDEQVAAITANRSTLEQRAQAALAANAAFLALPAPTTRDTTAQVQRLTKETNALIRLLLGLLDTVTDTA